MRGIFLDIETSGLNSDKHRTLEIAFEVIDLISGDVQASYHAFADQPKSVWELADKTSLQINGLSLDKMPCAIREEQIAKEITNLFNELAIERTSALYICQNPSFDRVFFSQIIDVDSQESRRWPYRWLDFASMVYAKRLEKAQKKAGPLPWEKGLSKDEIAKELGIAPEQKPHSAKRGVEHLIACYRGAMGFVEKLE